MAQGVWPVVQGVEVVVLTPPLQGELLDVEAVGSVTGELSGAGGALHKGNQL